MCAPGGSQGNFIMYPRATSGTNLNNNLFSSCSRTQMWSVLQARSAVCFTSKIFYYSIVNPLMLYVPKCSDIFKNIAAFAARLLECVRAFWEILHQRVKVNTHVLEIIVSSGLVLTKKYTIKKIENFR